MHVLDDCIFCLIGNKSDLERQVQYDEGIDFMNDNKIDFFFETSAKYNDKVTEMFEAAAEEMLSKSIQGRVMKDFIQSELQLHKSIRHLSGDKKSCC